MAIFAAYVTARRCSFCTAIRFRRAPCRWLERTADFLDALYWILLGRPLDDETRKTLTRNFELGQSRDGVMQAVLASSGFRQRHHDILDSSLTISGEDVVSRALADMPAPALVEPLDDQVWRRYEATPVDLRRNRYETPHILLSIDGTVFTSVMLFLWKQ